jgi:hypothetical protein
VSTKPDYLPLAWFWVALRRYRRDVIRGKDCDYPPGFLKAVGKYADKKFIFRSEIWKELQRWKQYAKHHPGFVPEGYLPSRAVPAEFSEREDIENFKNLILFAAFYGQKEILQILLETATLSKAPEPDVYSVRAVIKAFASLFRGARTDNCENDWPKKKEVRQMAEEILKEAGRPIPGTREWPRIFRKAGLSGLRSKPRQSKSSRNT